MCLGTVVAGGHIVGTWCYCAVWEIQSAVDSTKWPVINDACPVFKHFHTCYVLRMAVLITLECALAAAEGGQTCCCTLPVAAARNAEQLRY
jgi:hypothetical protein